MDTACAIVGLGSNLGDRARRIETAFAAIAALPGTRLLRASALYHTPAWGRMDQPDFLNAAALVDTALPPRALLDRLLTIEVEAGRDRAADDRWGPRTLDLDLLLYGDVMVDEPGLQLPHPHLHVRAFALVPLLEIAPDAWIPGRGPARDALTALDAAGTRAVKAIA